MDVANISLFKRHGVYYITYLDDGGIRKQKSTRCKNKSEALKVLSDFKKFLSETKSRPTTLSVFVKDFLDFSQTNYASHTTYLYKRTLDHFKRICGDLPLAKYTPKHYDLFKVTRLNEIVQGKISKDAKIKRTMNPITVNIELRSLRAVFNRAVRWEVIEKNPFQGLSQISIPKRTPAFLTAEDAETLLSNISEQWMKDFVIFAVNTGMRRGEMLSLRWIDIDTSMRVARITNRKEFTTKSGEERVVFLNDPALMVIARREARKSCEYVFTDDEGRKLLKDRVTHAFKAAIRVSGLPEGLHLHSTRHSFASLLVGGGTSLFTVSKLLGHSNVKTSEIYSHLLPQHLHNEVDKINIGIDCSGLTKN